MKALLLLLPLSILLASCTQAEDPKPTLEDKLTTLKQLRADKAQKQKEIYLIDQKIVPLKCSIFSEVGAKEQWNLECQDFYQEQQSKIQNSTPETPEEEKSDV